MPSLSLNPDVAVAVGLVGVRTYAWMQVVPPFSGSYIPKTVRLGAALGVGLALSSEVKVTSVPAWPMLIADAGAQIVIGAAFGLLIAIIIQAATSAGDSLDLFGGLVLPQSLTPIGFPSTSSLGQFYGLITIALLIVTRGDLLLLRGFITTFIVIGPTFASLLPLAHGAISATSTFFTATFEIAGPLLVVEFIIQAALGLVAKAAPNVNIFLFAFSVQSFALILVLALGTTLLPNAVSHLVHASIQLEGRLL